MKKRIYSIMLLFIVLCGCSDVDEGEKLALREQTVSQLGFSEKSYAGKYDPQNYEVQKAVWVTMEDMRKAVTGSSKEAFTDNISSIFEKIKSIGANTVYLHVRAYNDAYYSSDIFPYASGATEEYDPLEIALNSAHSRGLSVHAWINPLRCMTDEQMKKLGEGYIIKKWYENNAGEYISKSGDRWYLDPAYEEVRELIGDGVTELVSRYDVDGIHIDDYFYPTKEEEFDKPAFESSGSDDLESWRRENINIMVKEIYDRVKAEDTRILFGISPQGNISIDVDDLYADVRLWCSEKGYCDYIVPQLYYGFKNENMPFEKTFFTWKEMVCKEVDLVAGICTYKSGKEDKWAGSGSREWIDDSDISSREVGIVLAEGAGAALFSAETLFSDSQADERERIKDEFLKADDIQ